LGIPFKETLGLELGLLILEGFQTPILKFLILSFSPFKGLIPFGILRNPFGGSNNFQQTSFKFLKGRPGKIGQFLFSLPWNLTKGILGRLS